MNKLESTDESVDLWNYLNFTKENEKGKSVHNAKELSKFVANNLRLIKTYTEQAKSLLNQCIESNAYFLIKRHPISTHDQYKQFTESFEYATNYYDSSLNTLKLKSKQNSHCDIEFYTHRIESYIKIFNKTTRLMRQEIFLFGAQRMYNSVDN